MLISKVTVIIPPSSKVKVKTEKLFSIKKVFKTYLQNSCMNAVI